MMGLVGVWSWLIEKFDRKDPRTYVAVQIAIAPRQQIRPTTRSWSATDKDDGQALLVGHEAVRRFAKLQPYWGESGPNEATTRENLVAPILGTLGWSPLLAEQPHSSGGRTDYEFPDQGVITEVKRADPKYDSPDSRNNNNRFKTVMEQNISYMNDDYNCVIYTNGRFWWRIEKNELDGRIHALRFDMNLAKNTIQAHGYFPQLQHFVNLFHFDAFARVNNYSLPIHPGRSVEFEGIGAVMVKDLVRGLGRSSLDD